MTMHPAKKKRYDVLGPRVVEALEKRHFEAYYCSSSEEVLPLLLSLIPKDHVVSWGGSETLVSLGAFDAVLAAGYKAIDRRTAKSPEEKVELMRHGLLCDTFLMSANAISEDGCLVNIDGEGNRVAALIYGPKNVIVVAGMNKVTRDAEAAVSRARNVAAPMVIQRFPTLKTPCIASGSCADCQSDDCICSFITVTRRCRHEGRIKVILVGEDMGF